MGVLKIFDVPESPNVEGCLRDVINRNREIRERAKIYDEPK